MNEVTTLLSISGRWCFTDGSWKDKGLHSGQGWYSTLEDFDGLLGAQNTRASHSPLHPEVERLFEKCNAEEFTSVSGYICNRLFSISEYSFVTIRMACFC